MPCWPGFVISSASPSRILAQEVPAIRRENSGKLRPIIDLSTIGGAGRERLFRDLHLSDLDGLPAA